MPMSTRFREMRARLTELRHHMLPASFSATGGLQRSTIRSGRAGYRVLVHAEIESYLEDIAREAVTRGDSRVENKIKRPSTILLAFFGGVPLWMEYK